MGARTSILSVAFPTKSTVKGPTQPTGAEFGDPQDKNVAPVLIRANSLLPEKWELVLISGNEQDAKYYIKHIGVISMVEDPEPAWTFVPEGARAGSAVLITAEIEKRSVWEIKEKDLKNKEGTIRLVSPRSDVDLFWGLESGDDETEVKLRENEDDRHNIWRFEGIDS